MNTHLVNTLPCKYYKILSNFRLCQLSRIVNFATLYQFEHTLYYMEKYNHSQHLPESNQKLKEGNLLKIYENLHTYFIVISSCVARMNITYNYDGQTLFKQFNSKFHVSCYCGIKTFKSKL